MPSLRRPVLALVVALALSGCTPPDGEPSPASPASPTSSTDLTATTAWASTVCTEVRDLSAALNGIGDELTIDPTGGTEGLEETGTQVESQVREVGGALDDVRAAIAAAPDDPVSQEARASLEGTLADVEAKQNEALEQTRAVFGSGSVPDAVAAAARAFTALQEALGGVGDLIGTATGEGSEDVRAAFAGAPECEGSGG